MKRLTIILSAILLTGLMVSPVKAVSFTPDDDFYREYNSENNEKSASMLVTADIPSEFFIVIPTSVNINDTTELPDGTYDCEGKFQVGINGNIRGNEYITIDYPDTILMKGMLYNEGRTAHIHLDSNNWYSEELYRTSSENGKLKIGDNFAYSNGKIKVNLLDDDLYVGSMVFKVSLNNMQ